MQENEELILAWCRNTIDTLKDGGIFAIPRSLTVFRVDKTAKSLIVLEGCEQEISATKYWFAKIGYSVIEKQCQQE